MVISKFCAAVGTSVSFVCPVVVVIISSEFQFFIPLTVYFDFAHGASVCTVHILPAVRTFGHPFLLSFDLLISQLLFLYALIIAAGYIHIFSRIHNKDKRKTSIISMRFWTFDIKINRILPTHNV